MLSFLTANLSTILVGAAVFGLVGLSARLETVIFVTGRNTGQFHFRGLPTSTFQP